jgi:hypothetical protein
METSRSRWISLSIPSAMTSSRSVRAIWTMPSARAPSHPMAPFLPLFVDRDQGLTTAEMYLEHVFPHYTRSNTERALHGSGIVFPSADDDGLLDRNIGRLIATGYLTARPRAHAG